MSRLYKTTSAKSCARCHRRKTKCDLGLPSCGSCDEAGAECKAFDPSTGRERPRNLVAHLEETLKRLETELEVYNTEPERVPITIGYRVAAQVLTLTDPSRASFFHHTGGRSSLLFLRPSCLPLSVARQKTTSSTRHPSNGGQSSDARDSSLEGDTQSGPVSMANLSSIPQAHLCYIFDNYLKIQLPQYPCVDAAWLSITFKKVLSEGLGNTEFTLQHAASPESGLSHYHYFVVFMCLAISLSSLTRNSDSRAQLASNSFLISAMQHFLRMSSNTSLEALQTSLLLAHYSQANPERVDSWLCISNATRLALSLGLHRSIGGLQLDESMMRRRLFWMVYGMERTMCTVLNLPLTFPEESIDPELESMPGDTVGLGTQMQSKLHAFHLYLVRKLQTEVHRILYLCHDLPQFDIWNPEIWLSSITSQIDSWYEKANDLSTSGLLEFRTIIYLHLKMRIFRPTPRLMMPTNEARMECLKSCRLLLDEYRSILQKGRLFWTWHAMHYLFEIASVMLHACWTSRNSLAHYAETLDLLSTSLPLCIDILSKLSTRWRAANTCIDHIRPLIQQTQSAIESKAKGLTIDSSFEQQMSTDIDLLLFPDQAGQADFWETDTIQGSFADLSGAGFDDFDWNLDWESMNFFDTQNFDLWDSQVSADNPIL